MFADALSKFDLRMRHINSKRAYNQESYKYERSRIEHVFGLKLRAKIVIISQDMPIYIYNSICWI